MKFLIVFTLAVFSTTAFTLAKEVNHTKQLVGQHEGRIAGGEAADIVKFSYQVGLLLNETIEIGYWCGGSLIAPNWVLTAAHCTKGMDRITVYLGSAIRAQAEVEFDIIRSYDNIIEHDYESEHHTNDIALIRIPTVKYSKNINPVRLPPAGSDESLVGEYGTISGWGYMSDKVESIVPLLQSVTLRIISNDQCANKYNPKFFYAGKICVATDDDYIMRSPCQGDSGGPMVLQGTNIQIGLTSFGATDGCEKGHPTAFTRLSYYMDWIVENMEKYY